VEPRGGWEEERVLDALDGLLRARGVIVESPGLRLARRVYQMVIAPNLSKLLIASGMTFRLVGRAYGVPAGGYR